MYIKNRIIQNSTTTGSPLSIELFMCSVILPINLDRMKIIKNLDIMETIKEQAINCFQLKATI